MGKQRIAAATERQQHVTPTSQTATTTSTARSIRKRKRAALKTSNAGGASAAAKCQRISGVTAYEWHENDDEDSSSSGSVQDAEHNGLTNNNTAAALLQTPQGHSYPAAATHLLNASDHHTSNATESPRPVYTLRPSVVNGVILRDVLSKAWRLGRPIGKGNFGEIFLASDDAVCPVSSESAKYVVKIEPHSNGPLFVEIHCLINTSQAKELKEENEAAVVKAPTLPKAPPSGIPSYIASGTHYFGDARYRFLVLPRFDRDLHSLIKNHRVQQKSLLVLAIHILNVLENLHDKGYCHNDIKAQNLMISKCKYLKKQVISSNGNGNTKKNYDEHYEEKQQTTDSGNSSEQETNDDDYYNIKDEKFSLKRIMAAEDEELDDMEDEDFDDGATTNSNNSNSLDMYRTPVSKNRKRRGRGPTNSNVVEFSGSNPVRSCRREKRNSMYEEMVKSHYLRPTKRVSYAEFFNEDGLPPKADAPAADQSAASSDNESEEFVPPSAQRSKQKKSASKATATRRATRRQDQKVKVESLTARKNAGGAQAASGRRSANAQTQFHYIPVEEEHVFLIDFGLASKYQDRGVHRPFIMDQRRAHDGTLEFTSRDAHLGAHSRRSDLECLGYNLLYWSEGYLPWKDVAAQQQQEKVHRAKELFMTDVREMARQFYGKQVPKYLGEFLQQIGQLAYQERPNYGKYRQIFTREYQRLGYDLSQMSLSSEEIVRTRLPPKDEVDGETPCGDIFELNNKLPSAAAMRYSSAHSTPFQDHSLTNRVSPKNLRSKSNKKNAKKKKFSWAEVLSQDPDQIARERAVKEFEREEGICPLQSRLPRRYEGKPTYAILAQEQSRRERGLAVQEHNDEDEEDEEEEEEVEEDEEQEEEEEPEQNGQETDEENHENEEDNEEMSVDDEEEFNPRQPRKSSVVALTTSNRGTRPRGRPAGSKKAGKPLTAVVSNKRSKGGALASAAGEFQDKAGQRRSRRCLYKTELHQGSGGDVENNSNDSFYNGADDVWTKYDDENHYGKGRHVTSSRHGRK